MKPQLLLLLTFFCTISFGQTINYTNQQLPVKYGDEVQLVANISGSHHLLVLPYRGTPLLYIYDAMLNLRYKKVLPIKLLATDDVRIISYKDFYYLLTRQAESKKTELWKITANGE